MDALVMTLGGAAIAGFSGSPHCALMCGPLACAGLPREKGPRARAALAWHAARISAYAGVGALLGGTGALVFSPGVQRFVPWLMAIGLVAAALDLGRWLKPLPGAGRLAQVAMRLPPVARSALLGAATPLLPCGLLYGMLLAVTAAGSAASGAGLMAAFALGGTAALAAAQLPGFTLHRLPVWARRTVLIAAAAVLIWRAEAAPQAASCHDLH